MAQIVTITNPLTGQPAQVDQLDHTAQQIDEGIKRAREYGLGTVGKRLYSSDDLNTIWESGFYSWGGTNKPANFIENAPSEFWISVMEVISYGDGSINIQRVWGLNSADAPILAQRVKYGDTILPWEYDNPPMELGKEYRTTERFYNCPVYKKLVTLGKAPAAGSTATINGGHKISGIKYAISAIPLISKSGYSYALQDSNRVSNVEFGNIDIAVTLSSTAGNLTSYDLLVLLTYAKAN